MSISGVSSPHFLAQAGTAIGLSIPGGDDFASKLQVGQIIKGRVLRHYEGGRYAVDFNGQEKVVDSAVPLKANELLYGKVVGLGERVELERIRHRSPVSQAPAETFGAKHGGSADPTMRMVADLFAQHQLHLPADQAVSWKHIVNGAADQRLMAQAALLLTKLGVAITPEWLTTIYDLLRTDSRRGQFALSGKAIELQTAGADAPADSIGNAPSASELAALLKQFVEDWSRRAEQDSPQTSLQQDDPDSGAGATGSDSGEQPDPSKWLLNVQTGAAVRHRVNTIPLLVNGQLLELNIAVFEQTDARPEQTTTRHRQLSFSLRTKRLGLVEAQLILTGEHVKMRLTSDHDAGVETLSDYSSALFHQFSESGWSVDEMHYELTRAEPVNVARTVLKYVVNQNSLSRLI